MKAKPELKGWDAPPLLTLHSEVISEEKGEEKFQGGRGAQQCTGLALRGGSRFSLDFFTASLWTAAWCETHSCRRCTTLKSGWQTKCHTNRRGHRARKKQPHYHFCVLSRSFTKRIHAFFCRTRQWQKYIYYPVHSMCAPLPPLEYCPPPQTFTFKDRSTLQFFGLSFLLLENMKTHQAEFIHNPMQQRGI